MTSIDTRFIHRMLNTLASDLQWNYYMSPVFSVDVLNDVRREMMVGQSVMWRNFLDTELDISIGDAKRA